MTHYKYVFIYLDCAAVLISPVAVLARPSGRLSVCPVRVPKSETRRRRKNNKIGANALHSRSNRCANFQFERTRVKGQLYC